MPRSRILLLACSLLLLTSAVALAQTRFVQVEPGTPSYDPLAPESADKSTQKNPRP